MKNRLYFTHKAKYFEESLPVGNGRIGGLVFGNLKKEKIALNEDTLWSGYPKDNNKKDAYKYLDSARKAIFEKDYRKAEEIINTHMHGEWSDAYMPFGDIIINYDKKYSKDYSRTLDLQTGVATVSAGGLTETVFVSYPAQLMVVNIKCDSGVSFTVNFDCQLNHSVQTKEDSLVLSGQAPEICRPPYYNKGESIVYGDKGMKFCGVIKVLGNAKFSGDSIIVNNQKETTLLVSLATSYVDFKSMPTANASERAYSYFDNAKNYEALLSEHKTDFSSLFNRVEFTLEGGYDELPTDKRIKNMNKKGDDYSLVALLFQYGRYLTISSSRKGSRASTLQGIWNTHLRAPWSSGYTVNINTEMNYWCTDIANLSDCFDPLVELVEKLAYNGEKTAKDYYGCRGFCAHHNTDIWGMTFPAGDPEGKEETTQYAAWPMGGAWFLNQLYDHYCYTLDEDYKKRIIPLFESGLAFYKDFLVEKDGKLVTCPSISPENKFKDAGTTACITYMPSMDRELLFEFFTNCRELGFNTPAIEQVAPACDGRIPEYAEEFGETEVEHRHVSHLYCIYPSRLEESDELKKAAEKSLLKRGFGGTGWSLGWKVCLWARLCNGENAYRLIKQQLTFIRPNSRFHRGGGSYPNLFDAHPPFQIDGNFGVCAGIGEMLKNEALPKEWTGSVRGIKTHGGKEISYSFKNGKRI